MRIVDTLKVNTGISATALTRERSVCVWVFVRARSSKAGCRSTPQGCGCNTADVSRASGNSLFTVLQRPIADDCAGALCADVCSLLCVRLAGAVESEDPSSWGVEKAHQQRLLPSQSPRTQLRLLLSTIPR